MPQTNIATHYESLTQELEALKNRVRHYIDDAHWLTDGEWKESVLRAVIARHLPDSVKIGRGFVMTKSGPTTQCDILLYRSDCPVLFRDGDLVFVTPDAVLGVIEVKSSLDAAGFTKAVTKLKELSAKLGPRFRRTCALALFSYETNVSRKALPQVAEVLRGHRMTPLASEGPVIRFINLGCDTFIRWWDTNPSGSGSTAGLVRKWRAYHLESKSAGYFVSNIIDWLCPASVDASSSFWFPKKSKELWQQFDVSG